MGRRCFFSEGVGRVGLLGDSWGYALIRKGWLGLIEVY